jgi:hypothetical protein
MIVNFRTRGISRVEVRKLAQIPTLIKNIYVFYVIDRTV